MNVVLDARTVGRRFSGVGFYVLELVRAFSTIDAAHQYHLLLHGDSALEDLRLDERFQFHRKRVIVLSSIVSAWGEVR